MSEKNNTQMRKKLLNSLDVFNFFSKDYNSSIYGRELARLLNVNQRSISNHLINLENEKLLISKNEGKIKRYSLNLNNLEVINYLVLAEENKLINLFSVNKAFKEFFNRIKFRVDGNIILFGSYARSDFSKKSDIDLLVMGKHDLSKFVKIYPFEVHIIDMNRSTFEKGLMKKENFMLEILKNHILVKGTHEIIEMFWRFYNGKY